jgi:predicted dehydrogenase
VPYKIAIVGVGPVALNNYIPFLAEQDDLELGYFNRTVERAHSAAQQHPGPVFDSIDEVGAWRPDIAFVLTSERVRLKFAQELVTWGVPRLFLEKPLVAALGQTNVTEEDFFAAKDFVRAASRVGCEVAINFNYRSFDLVSRAQKLVQERNLGALTTISARAHYACWSHCIDLIGFFGGPIERLNAIAGEQSRSGPGMDAVDLAVSFRTIDGAVGSLVGSAASPWQHALFEISLDYQRGRIVLSDLDGSMTVLQSAERYVDSVRLGADSSRWNRYDSSFRAALTSYLTTVRSKATPPVTAVDGLRELQVEAAIRRSSATGHTIDIEKEFPL